jgi:hypothetical protein
MVELSGDEIGQIRAGQTIAKQSSGTSHTHMVTLQLVTRSTARSSD